MKLGSYKRQKISVSDLLLDLENFRTGSVSNQTEAITALIKRNSTKIKGLITSIAENGFLDLEIPCVYPSPDKPGKYIVAEGNRRTSALKMLRTPDLAKNTSLLQDIKKLKQEFSPKIPLKIECAVFQSKKDCLSYILMRHGYGTDGSGVIQWNSISKLRADSYVNGKIHQELLVLKLVEEHGSLSDKHRQLIDDDDIKITNLARLTDDANIKSILSIKDNNCSISENGQEWLLKIWQRVVEIIIDGEYKGEKFTVDRNINDTSQRQDFIREIISEAHPSATSQTSVATPATTSNPNTISAPPPRTVTPTSHQPTNKRKGLIPKGFHPANLQPQKVVNICDELKKLEAKSFPHCAGAMFRIFIEFGIEAYLKNNPTVQPAADKLSSKIGAVANDLESRGIMTKKQLKPVRDIISKTSHPVSTETLNAYVHNPHVSPDAETLKTEWDNIQHFAEILWKK